MKCRDVFSMEIKKNHLLQSLLGALRVKYLAVSHLKTASLFLPAKENVPDRALSQTTYLYIIDSFGSHSFLL